MTLQSGNRKWLIPAIEMIPDTLLDELLEYVFADHFRQRAVLATL